MLFSKENNKLKLIIATTLAITLITSPGIAMHNGSSEPETIQHKDKVEPTLELKVREEIQSITDNLKNIANATNVTGNINDILFAAQCTLYTLLSSNFGNNEFQELEQAISESLSLYYSEILKKLPMDERCKIIPILENTSNPTLCALNVLKNLPTPPEIEKEIEKYRFLLDQQFITSIPTALGMEILEFLEKTYQLQRSVATQVLLSIPFQLERPLRQHLLWDFGKYLGDMRTRQPSVFETLRTMNDNELEKAWLLTGFCKTYDGGEIAPLERYLQSITDPLCRFNIAEAIIDNESLIKHFEEFIENACNDPSINPVESRRLKAKFNYLPPSPTYSSTAQTPPRGFPCLVM